MSAGGYIRVTAPLQILNRVRLPDDTVPSIAERHVRLVTSGRDGAPGAVGEDGWWGRNGLQGMPGENGSSALPQRLSLYVRDGRVVLDADVGSLGDQGTYSLPLGDPYTSIYLAANGGHGGDGGHGGHGGRGVDGSSGADATRYSAAVNGGPGGDGGDGGDGGPGGQAGHAARIDISVNDEDTDLLLLVKRQPRTTGGYGGQGGRGGDGGSGGQGGRGGRGFTWSERDPQGHYHQRSRPSGAYGSPGRSGRPGLNGVQGTPGRDATFTIHVHGQGSFPSRYDLSIVGDVAVIDSSQYGVIEPGSPCSVQYHVINCGGMPTPRLQRIFASAEPTQWVQPCHLEQDGVNGAVELPVSIPASTEHLLIPTPFYVKITDIDVPSVGSPLSFCTKIFHRATLERINQDFPLVSDRATVVSVTYPLQMSYVYGQVCLVANGYSIVAWRVKNIGEKAIGIDAPLPRKAATRLCILDSDRLAMADMRGNCISNEETDMGYVPSDELSASKIRFHRLDEEEFTEYEPGNSKGLLCPIPIIRPSESITFFRVISINDLVSDEQKNRSSVTEHSTIRLTAHLDMGHPVTRDSLREIQVRPFQLQVATPFTYELGVSRILLVVNNRTTSEEISSWRAMCAGSLQASPEAVAIWNVSLYGGLSFKYRVQACVNAQETNELQSLAKRFSTRDSMVVILNNSCTPCSVQVDTTEDVPLRVLYQDELLHACNDHGCRFYIAGTREGYSWRHALQVPTTECSVRTLNSMQTLVEWSPSILWPDDLVVSDVLSGRQPKTDAEVVPATAPYDLKVTFRKKRKSGLGSVKRVFLLQKSEKMLYYFEKENSIKPSGSIPLDSSIVCSLQSNRLKIETNHRVLALQVSSSNNQEKEDTLNAWRDAIESIVTTQVKTSDSSKATEKDLEQRGFDMSRPENSGVVCSSRVLRRNAGDDNTVKKQAEQVASELASIFPELMFCVVYRYITPEDQERNRGILATQRGIGDVTVFPGAHYDEGGIVVDLSDSAGDTKTSNRLVHNGTRSLRDVYGFLKGLSFSQKVVLLKNVETKGVASLDAQNLDDAWLSLLVDAIASDIADELAIFSFGKESIGDKLTNVIRRSKKENAVSSWTNRMRRLRVLTEVENLGTLSGEKFEQVFRLCAIIQLLARCVVPATARVMKVGRSGIISLAARKAIDHLISLLCNAADVTHGKDLKNGQGKTLDSIQKEWKRQGVSCSEGDIPIKNVVIKMRKLHDFGTPWAAVDSNKHVPLVLSMDDFDAVRQQSNACNVMPNISPPSTNSTPHPSVDFVRQFLEQHAPAEEVMDPIEV